MQFIWHYLRLNKIISPSFQEDSWLAAIRIIREILDYNLWQFRQILSTDKVDNFKKPMETKIAKEADQLC